MKPPTPWQLPPSRRFEVGSVCLPAERSVEDPETDTGMTLHGHQCHSGGLALERSPAPVELGASGAAVAAGPRLSERMTTVLPVVPDPAAPRRAPRTRAAVSLPPLVIHADHEIATARASRSPGLGKRRLLLVGLPLLGLSVVAAAFWRRDVAHLRRVVTAATGAPFVPSTSEPVNLPAADGIRAAGKVTPVRQTRIHARIAGVVTDVYVEEGESVRAGDVLLRLDPSTQQRNLERLAADAAEKRALLRQARMRQASARDGVEQDVVSRGQLRSASSDVTLARAQLQSALAAARAVRDQIGYMVIVAPFDGQITLRNVQPGEAVAAGPSAGGDAPPLLVLADPSSLAVQLRLLPTEWARVHMGQAARISLDALPGVGFEGHVVALDEGSIAGAPAWVKVRFSAGQDLSAVAPAMLARVEIVAHGNGQRSLRTDPPTDTVALSPR
jgi:RND family efflux transporter MFP subunit